MNIRLLPKFTPSNDADRQARSERDMINWEAQIGGQLFGPVPKGHNRRFFCLDEHTWIWHEEWVEKGQRHVITTRYEVRPNGILKVQEGQPTQRLSLHEGRNLYRAIELYYERVSAEYQRQLQAA